MRIAIAADHNAVAMKSRLAAWLSERGHQVDDRGVHDAAEIADYPPLCEDVGSQVVGGENDFGVILGGSGCGEQIAANKIAGVRAALTGPGSEIRRQELGIDITSTVVLLNTEGRQQPPYTGDET